MPRNIHLTTQQSRSVLPLDTGRANPLSAEAVVVDERTYWTGKVYVFGIENRNAYSRWYRIVITNLKRGDEYVVQVNHDRLDEDCLFEIAPGDEYEARVALGGEQQQEPAKPRKFEVYVEEYATPDENGRAKVISTEDLQWIPIPASDAITLTIREPEIRVRPWPWKQKVQFHASLTNRSFLPITAIVRAVPDEDNKEAGLEETQEALRQPIPPLKEQPVLFDITLEKKLTAPVLVSVSADTKVPSLDMPLSIVPQAVEIVPVPWLKVWTDWVVVGLAAILVFWALFGMPPVVHPTTRLVLTLKDWPRDARPEDLKVTLTPKSRDGSPLNLEYRKGRPVPGAKGGVFSYDFDWGMSPKGFRWAWPVYDLILTVEPTGPRAALYDVYDLSVIALKSDGKEEATISRRNGVSAENLQAELPRKSSLNLLIVLDPNTTPKDEVIALTILVNGQALPNTTYVAGDTINVPDTLVSKHKTLEIRVTATNQSGTLETHSTVHPVLQSEPVRVPLPPFQKAAGGKPAIVTPPVPGGTPSTGGTPITGGKPTTAGTSGTATSTGATTGTAGTGGKPTSAGTAGTGGKPTSAGTSGHVVDNSQTKIDPAIMKQWCEYLNLPGLADALTLESKAVGGLQQPNVTLNGPHPNGEFALTVSAKEDCVYQIYDVSKTKEGGYFPQPIYGPIDDMFGKPSQRPANPADGRPVLLKQGSLGTLPARLNDGDDYLIFVVLAYRAPQGRIPDADLLQVLKDTNGKGFAIWCVEYHKK